jgi:acyl-CoA thioesterase
MAGRELKINIVFIPPGEPAVSSPPPLSCGPVEPLTRFDRDTAVRPSGPDRFEVRLDPGWWIRAGPNGGYVGAILLRALTAAVSDPARVPRSFTVHYTARPGEGPAQVETRLEREGRSLTTASGRLVQEGRLCALALGAFSLGRESPAFQQATPPEVEAPERLGGLPPPIDSGIPMRERYECRPIPGLGASRSENGGWIRLAEPRLLDAPLALACMDAWPPSVFTRLGHDVAPRGVPTVDLTVHFRVALPLADARPDAFYLALFQTRALRDGFLEEDGELWSRDGVLLAQSRQLAVLLGAGAPTPGGGRTPARASAATPAAPARTKSAGS